MEIGQIKSCAWPANALQEVTIGGRHRLLLKRTYGKALRQLDKNGTGGFKQKTAEGFPMQVRYIHERDLGTQKVVANIMWQGSWPMKRGEFPSDHPCFVHKAGVEAFRARGYEVSPFPEGDGITMGWTGKPAAEVIRDIEACIGWQVTNKG